MARHSAATPAGHGEVLTSPPVEQWADIMSANALLATGWEADLCGSPIQDVRRAARREAIDLGRRATARLGVPATEVPDEPDLIVMTGHQPELYHPGVWVKDFLLDSLARQTGAAGIDLVVDSDSFDVLGIHSPCLHPEVRVCTACLAVGESDGCFATASVPSAEDLDVFCRAGAENLATLPAPALRRHWATFCEAIKAARPLAANLAELVTGARRRFEATAGTGYLELPVSEQASGIGFSTFVADIVVRAEAFTEAYNGELAAYRERTGTRSAAQPFPDLRREGELYELPLWILEDGHRGTVWARPGDAPAIVTDDGREFPLATTCEEAPRALLAAGLRLAPKAVTLTMFNRVFVADLFIHGVGGGRYDQVTDALVRRFYGIEPLRFVVASMTMYLPLGAHIVTDDEVEDLTQQINRIRHNPDQMLGELEFDDAAERDLAWSLAGEKTQLVAEIAAPGADKKALGMRIREVNDALAALLGSYEAELRDELDTLLQLRDASEILTDRTYPFCFWDPTEVADKVR